MPRLDPFEQDQLPEIAVEYSDPKVWSQMERGDMVRDINRLLVTAKEAQADLDNYAVSYRQVADDIARLRRSIHQIRHYILSSVMADGLRDALLDSLILQEDR